MLKELLKKLYYLYFSIYKHFKYPTCKINTNFIMPNVILGKEVIIRSGCKVQNNISIGDYTSINENTQIDTNCKSIGKYCSISHGVKIGMGSHPIYHLSTSTVFYEQYRGYIDEQLFDEYEDKGFTIIGHDVLIGANAIIMAGISIGHGSVIGAGSIVTKDVSPYSIVAGNPAKVIKYRFDEKTIEELLKIKWWDKDIKDLVSNTNLIKNTDEFIKEYKVD